MQKLTELNKIIKNIFHKIFNKNTLLFVLSCGLAAFIFYCSYQLGYKEGQEKLVNYLCSKNLTKGCEPTQFVIKQ